MEAEKKEAVVIKLKEDAKGDRLYWITIILSGIIATLWLLNNSVAVVIWAMLIAPLLRPINWLSYAIARWGSKSFSESARSLILSIVIPIIFAYLITKILWIYKETPEILARISPNILDFFIAGFSAAVAILSLRFEKLSESIAWVALAASLMPPLAVIGIELAFWNITSAFWAFMLFLANLWAIIFVSILFLWSYGYTPHRLKLQKQSFQRTLFVIFSIFTLLIPLYFSFHSIKNNASVVQKTETILKENIWKILYAHHVSEVYLKKDTKHIDIIFRVQQGSNVDQEILLIKNKLTETFSDEDITFVIELRYIELL